MDMLDAMTIESAGAEPEVRLLVGDQTDLPAEAFLRRGDVQQQVLMPLYLRSAGLPYYMQMIQYVDAREADRGLITAAASALADVI